MVVANAGSWNAGSDVGAAIPYRDVWRSAFAKGDAADAVFAEVDAHAFAQADAFANPESHALPFDSASLGSYYMAFGGCSRYFDTSRSAFLLHPNWRMASPRRSEAFPSQFDCFIGL